MISRAGEPFDRCKRKCKVDFPDEARGWLTLHRSGLNNEQRAVILARSNGSLKRDDIGRAMRSCYPDFVVLKKKSFGLSLVEEEGDSVVDDDDMEDLDQEVEALLAVMLRHLPTTL